MSCECGATREAIREEGGEEKETGRLGKDRLRRGGESGSGAPATGLDALRPRRA